jgi:hypothetical protein
VSRILLRHGSNIIDHFRYLAMRRAHQKITSTGDGKRVDIDGIIGLQIAGPEAFLSGIACHC